MKPTSGETPDTPQKRNSVCYCGGKYVCAKHRDKPEPEKPRLDYNARPATPEETAFVRDILGIVAGR